MKKTKEQKELEAIENHCMQWAVEKVGTRMKLIHSLAFAIDILVNDVDQSLVYQTAGGQFIPIGMKREKKQIFKDFRDHLIKADDQYDRLIQPDLYETAKDDWKKIDHYRRDANELVRLLMLYIDRIPGSEAQAFIEDLEARPEGGIFPKDIISRFNFK